MNRACVVVLCLLSVAFAVGRFTLIQGHRSLSVAGSYEAMAHIFVGGLIGAYLASKERTYLWFALVLSAVELAAFFTLGRGQ